VYPDAARQAGVEGVVYVRCTITTAGLAAHCKIVSGHPLLDESALTSLRLSRFAPATSGGVPVEMLQVFKFRFAM
jgi:TonB family protein